MKRIYGRVQEAKQIDKKLIKTEIIAGQPRTFVAELKLDKYDFSKTAKVVLEATCAGSEIVQRFEFGTIRRIVPPKNRNLDEQLGERIRFRLKVVVAQKVNGKNLKLGMCGKLAVHCSLLGVARLRAGFPFLQDRSFHK